MADFIGLENELNTKGTKVYYEVRNNDETVTFIYDSVTDTKENMDGIVQSYLTNYKITSTLELNVYKGDAIIN
jgi:hypothetical protein